MPGPSSVRRRTTLAATTVLALGATLAAPAAAQAADRPTDPTALERVARSLQQPGPLATADPQRSERLSPRSAAPGGPASATLQQAVQGVVDDGAVGMTVRVDTASATTAAAAGRRDITRKAPAKTNSPFRVASNTKMMVATTAMQLVEDGTWSLDTTVDDVWPGLIGARGSQVTVRNLLQHSSGLPDGVSPLIVANAGGDVTINGAAKALAADYEPEQVLQAALAKPWLFEPGTQAVYSNTGYIVLGMLLEKQTGKPLAQLLEQRIFTPAGMQHTRYATTPKLTGNSLMDVLKSDGAAISLNRFDPELFAAAGAVVSTTEDLSDFTRALMTGRLVSKQTLTTMQQTRKVTTAVGPDGTAYSIDYGLGIYRLPDPCQPGAFLWGHDGATFGTLSLAVSSADGTRQVSAGWNGRYINTDGSTPYNPDDALAPALLASCD
ncbi:serine hydrolase domain-containing protein [Knoellia koreensis]|uniref:Beta-lactamase family protein n=1 Tax=Knoellia koreensis TaxID=2730921 RepID=A0A849HKI3_9MICO|nr:serine hydrolase domain-containing protein [Knoellia sp. DB2414S]NNM47928.1 beta-lactamase family protein [Knoellia sp. DB2414S]